MLFIDTLVAALWGDTVPRQNPQQNPHPRDPPQSGNTSPMEEASSSSSPHDDDSPGVFGDFHTPLEPAPAPLHSLPRPFLSIPTSPPLLASSAPAIAETLILKMDRTGHNLHRSHDHLNHHHHHHLQQQQQQQGKKDSDQPQHTQSSVDLLRPEVPATASRKNEELTVVDPDTFTATLVVHPFTLKNMARRFVHDLKWDLAFGGVNWRFYIHVLSSGQAQCDTALLGLKVVGDDTLGSLSGSVAHSQEDIAGSSLSSSVSSSPRSCSDEEPEVPAATFMVSWRVVSNESDVVVAVCPPSVHHIEPGDDYVVEFTDDEFNFATSLEQGLSLQVTIKLLPSSSAPHSPTPGQGALDRTASTSAAEGNDAGEDDEGNDVFYDSEEDEAARLALLQQQQRQP